jgi:drug/metabolite transporter (DMT)-like permease
MNSKRILKQTSQEEMAKLNANAASPQNLNTSLTPSRDIIEEDAISEIGALSLLSSSRFSLRRHTIELDLKTSTYVPKAEGEESSIGGGPFKPGDYYEPEKSNTLMQKVLSMRGYLFMIASAFMFSLAAILIKRSYLLAGSDNSVIRYGLQLIVMFLYARFKRINIIGKKSIRKLLCMRGLIGVIAIVSLHFSVTLVAPSDSIAVANSSIIVTAILAKLFLKEKLTCAHICAVVMTIVGIVLISQPTFIFPRPIKYKIIENNSTIRNCSLDLFIETNNDTQLVDVINELEFRIETNELNDNEEAIKYENRCLHVLIDRFKKKLNKSEEFWNDAFIHYLVEHEPIIERASYLYFIGIFFALVYSLGSSSVQILLKKLCMEKVHFAVATIYGAYFGFPVSLIISLTLFFTGISHKYFDYELHFHLLPAQLFFSLLSAIFGIGSQIALNLSLQYEDASRVSVLKSTDLLFTFLLQFFILRIGPDLLSIIGALLILFGGLFIISYKIMLMKQEKLMKDPIQAPMSPSK